VANVSDMQVIGDLDAAVRFAAANGGDAGRLGITGFCWGGRIVWLYAAHSAQLRAGVAWYGKLNAARDELHLQMPMDVAPGLKCPVLGLYGAKDESIPLADVDLMRDAAKPSGSQIIVYPEAGHGFHADYRPMYHKESAEDGWARLTAWFAQHGVA
jgi:carboxymethylenebutenolidase